jgi:hypothetical protein
MRKSNLRNALVSAFTGAVLALAVMFTANIVTKKVRADEGGEWTCPPAPAGCAFDRCFHNGTGGHECKYIAIENGANCSSSSACEWNPGLNSFVV